MKKAFTLIELLIVTVILGMLSTTALLFFKDQTMTKAKQFTEKQAKRIKRGIYEKDVDSGDISGFVNDFGTLPPSIDFLRNHDISGNITKRRINDINSTAGSFPAPFMDEGSYNDSDLTVKKTNIQRVNIFSGYLGGYLATENNISVEDGWKTAMRLTSDLNSSQKMLTLTSAGSDRVFSGSTDSWYEEGFDQFIDSDDSLKAFYAEDINETYTSSEFMPLSLNMEFNLDYNATKVKVLIYSPMLYGVEANCTTEYNTTHATNCSGTLYDEYKPYILDAKADDFKSWFTGVIKYSFELKSNNLSVHINNKVETNINKYNIAMTYRGDGQDGVSPSPLCDTRPLFISSGKKEVVYLEYNGSSNQWKLLKQESVYFKNGKTVNLIYP